MRVTTTRVINGRIELDADKLPEGQLVRVVVLEEDPVRLSDEEREWLTSALAEARANELTDAFALLEEIEAAG